jgi:formate-dependent nitrite reductase membrane component NrfD
MPLLKSADWPLLIDLYFFLGGLAAGAFLIATAAHLMGGGKSRSVVRVGYYLALLAVIPGPLFLVIDLGVPSRFLHMLLVPKPDAAIGMGAVAIGPIHVKPFSPMNIGAWGLMGFSLCAFLAALAVFVEDTGRVRQRLDRFRITVGMIGGFFAFFLAAYPGVLLGATARPLWQNGHVLGLLFLAVGATSGAAAIILVLVVAGREAGVALPALRRMMIPTLALQVATLALFLIAVALSGAEGAVQALRVLVAGPYGVVFWFGAVVVGSLIPLALEIAGRRGIQPQRMAVSAVLVLVGGFLVKYVIVAAGQVVL